MLLILDEVQQYIGESNDRSVLVTEVAEAVASKPVVVVGMAQNPFVKKARRALDEAGVAFRYQDPKNYYVVRASALGGNVRFYKFVNGVRSDPLAADLVRRLYGATLRSSVSRIEDFGACPFRFFVTSGLRVEERRVSWDILDAWREAAAEAGIPPIAEFNRGDNFGSAYFQMNQRRGRRWRMSPSRFMRVSSSRWSGRMGRERA